MTHPCPNPYDAVDIPSSAKRRGFWIPTLLAFCFTSVLLLVVPQIQFKRFVDRNGFLAKNEVTIYGLRTWLTREEIGGESKWSVDLPNLTILIVIAAAAGLAIGWLTNVVRNRFRGTNDGVKR